MIFYDSLGFERLYLTSICTYSQNVLESRSTWLDQSDNLEILKLLTF